MPNIFSGSDEGGFGAVPEARVLTATYPLRIDGGDSANLSQDRTLSLDPGAIPPGVAIHGGANIELSPGPLTASGSIGLSNTVILGAGGSLRLGESPQILLGVGRGQILRGLGGGLVPSVAYRLHGSGFFAGTLRFRQLDPGDHILFDSIPLYAGVVSESTRYVTSGELVAGAAASGLTPPASPERAVQFNAGGAFGGDAALRWTPDAQLLVGHTVIVSGATNQVVPMAVFQRPTGQVLSRVTASGVWRAHDANSTNAAGYAEFVHTHANANGLFPRTFFYGQQAGASVTNYALYVAAAAARGASFVPTFLGVSTNADVKQADSTQAILYVTTNAASLVTLRAETAVPAALLFLGGADPAGGDANLALQGGGGVFYRSASVGANRFLPSGELAGTLVGGPDRSVQFNNAGALGGHAAFEWETEALTATLSGLARLRYVDTDSRTRVVLGASSINALVFASGVQIIWRDRESLTTDAQILMRLRQAHTTLIVDNNDRVPLGLLVGATQTSGLLRTYGPIHTAGPIMHMPTGGRYLPSGELAGGPPQGVAGSVQYNASGVFGGDPFLFWEWQRTFQNRRLTVSGDTRVYGDIVGSRGLTFNRFGEGHLLWEPHDVSFLPLGPGQLGLYGESLGGGTLRVGGIYGNALSVGSNRYLTSGEIGAGSPQGVAGSVQYNASGVFGGDAALTWEWQRINQDRRLTVSGDLRAYGDFIGTRGLTFHTFGEGLINWTPYEVSLIAVDAGELALHGNVFGAGGTLRVGRIYGNANSADGSNRYLTSGEIATGGGAAPGGMAGSVQYNASGFFGGDAALFWQWQRGGQARQFTVSGALRSYGQIMARASITVDTGATSKALLSADGGLPSVWLASDGMVAFDREADLNSFAALWDTVLMRQAPSTLRIANDTSGAGLATLVAGDTQVSGQLHVPATVAVGGSPQPAALTLRPPSASQAGLVMSGQASQVGSFLQARRNTGLLLSEITASGYYRAYDPDLPAGYVEFGHDHSQNNGNFPRSVLLGKAAGTPSNYGFYIGSADARGATQVSAFLGVSTNADFKQASSKQALIWVDTARCGVFSFSAEATGALDTYIGGSDVTGAGSALVAAANRAAYTQSIAGANRILGSGEIASAIVIAAPGAPENALQFNASGHFGGAHVDGLGGIYWQGNSLVVSGLATLTMVDDISETYARSTPSLGWAYGSLAQLAWHPGQSLIGSAADLRIGRTGVGRLRVAGGIASPVGSLETGTVLASGAAVGVLSYGALYGNGLVSEGNRYLTSGEIGGGGGTPGELAGAVQFNASGVFGGDRPHLRYDWQRSPRRLTLSGSLNVHGVATLSGMTRAHALVVGPSFQHANVQSNPDGIQYWDGGVCGAQYGDNMLLASGNSVHWNDTANAHLGGGAGEAGIRLRGWGMLGIVTRFGNTGPGTLLAATLQVSGSCSDIPDAGILSYGPIYGNGQWKAGGHRYLTSGELAAGAPGGGASNVQYNASGVFGGDGGLTWGWQRAGEARRLTVSGELLVHGRVTVSGTIYARRGLRMGEAPAWQYPNDDTLVGIEYWAGVDTKSMKLSGGGLLLGSGLSVAFMPELHVGTLGTLAQIERKGAGLLAITNINFQPGSLLIGTLQVSGASAAVPIPGILTYGPIYGNGRWGLLNGPDRYLTSGELAAAAATPPGSPDRAVQFNDGGVFGGAQGLWWQAATQALTASGGTSVVRYQGDYPGVRIADQAATLEPPVADMRVWLRADDLWLNDGESVALWPDRSGWGNDAVQVSGQHRPTMRVNAVNGKPAVQFSAAASGYMNLPNFMSGFSAGEIFIVLANDVDPGSSTPRSGLWNFGGPSGGTTHHPWTDGNIYETFGRNNSPQFLVGNPTASLTDWHLYSVYATSASAFAKLNASGIASTGTNTFAFPTSPRIGGSLVSDTAGGFAAWYDGKIAEVIFYNGLLTGAERTQVENYLQARYGLPYTGSPSASGAFGAALTLARDLRIGFTGADNAGAAVDTAIARASAGRLAVVTSGGALAHLTAAGLTISGSSAFGALSYGPLYYGLVTGGSRYLTSGELSAGTGSPAGPTGALQYNAAGVFGGDSTLRWEPAFSRLVASGHMRATGLVISNNPYRATTPDPNRLDFVHTTGGTAKLTILVNGYDNMVGAQFGGITLASGLGIQLDGAGNLYSAGGDDSAILRKGGGTGELAVEHPTLGVAGSVVRAGALVASGTGTLVYGGPVTAHGGAVVASGTLVVGRPGAVPAVAATTDAGAPITLFGETVALIGNIGIFPGGIAAPRVTIYDLLDSSATFQVLPTTRHHRLVTLSGGAMGYARVTLASGLAPRVPALAGLPPALLHVQAGHGGATALGIETFSAGASPSMAVLQGRAQTVGAVAGVPFRLPTSSGFVYQVEARSVGRRIDAGSTQAASFISHSVWLSQGFQMTQVGATTYPQAQTSIAGASHMVRTSGLAVSTPGLVVVNSGITGATISWHTTVFVQTVSG